MTQREEFEAWITAPPYERSVAKYYGPDYLAGEYRSDDVDLAWLAWQAATERALKLPQPDAR